MTSPEIRAKIIKVHNYDPWDESAIHERARLLEGKTLKELLTVSSFFRSAGSHLQNKGKGQIGIFIEERWFGLKRNSLDRPDFEQAGIELKIVPLEHRGKGLTVKERTKICSIHYHKLVEEEWERSHARKKLDKVLFIYFIYNAKDKLNSKVVKADLWKLNEISERTIIRDDWVRVKDKVAAGFAHELSESQSYILAASRTGQGRGRDEVTQPNSSKLALKRAFSLKQSYTKQRWEEISEGKEFVSILTQLHGATARNFIELFIKKLHEYQGVTLKDFARRFRIKVPRGKSAAATIVKKAIGFKNVGAPIKELDQLGIEVKVIPVRTKDLQPYEAVSFPAFVMNELVMEKWEEAELMEDLDSILFIPLLRWHRKTDKSLSTIGKAFIWSPSEEEWNIIEREWGQYRREIQQGKARTGLTKAPATQIIHVRPHAQNKDDVDIDPFGNKVVKQSFWLNKTFIAKLVQENLGEVKIGTR